MVPALLAMGLMGALPDWVSIAQAQGYYLAPEDAMALNSNVLTTALANSQSIGMAIGKRTKSGGGATAGGFRIDGIRIGEVELEGTFFADEDSAAGGSATGQLGGFLTAIGGFGDVDGELDYSNGGLIGGIDYQFSEAMVGGLAINWINTNTNYNGGGGGSERDSYGATLYTGYAVGDLSIDALFNYSFSDYTMTRFLNPLGGAEKATGTNNSDEIFLSAGVSYDFDLAGVKLVPGVQANLVKVWMDGYSETGALDPNDNATYAAFDVTSFTTDVGAEASYPIKVAAGLITPRIYGSWVHEFENDSSILSASVDQGATPLPIIITSAPDRNYMRIGAGVNMELQGGLEIYVDYEALLGFQGVSSNQFAVGGRFEF
jgi:outer membrane lipase/esterase